MRASEADRMMWASDAVLAESAAWRSSWHPAGSEYFMVDGYEFYQQEGGATLLNYRGPRIPGAEIIENALAIAASHGARAALVTVGPGPLGEVSTDILDRHGAETVAVVDVVAMEIGGPMPDGLAATDDLECRKVGVDCRIDEFEDVSRRAWGFVPPVLSDPSAAHDDDRTPGLFVARCAGVTAGAGGYSLAAQVARMWGAAVLPEFRRQGVYRALIGARVRDARDRGATLALVHAEQTSSPILQALGFRKFGERRRVRMSIGT
ncbi:GNAT family N-acetyltransferase [Gordonia sp. PKS22-38]|uniref:GNAT family N-acetyltransferase n=1 Tax=Gordonia prachuapensis TaxID=3115651 RepID=A0ABU7MW46_9ACTN|nr:GNAT family N-acetyltransferase [Gordonia sp. PKS22-38]